MTVCANQPNQCRKITVNCNTDLSFDRFWWGMIWSSKNPRFSPVFINALAGWSPYQVCYAIWPCANKYSPTWSRLLLSHFFSGCLAAWCLGKHLFGHEKSQSKRGFIFFCWQVPPKNLMKSIFSPWNKKGSKNCLTLHHLVVAVAVTQSFTFSRALRERVLSLANCVRNARILSKQLKPVLSTNAEKFVNEFRQKTRVR